MKLTNSLPAGLFALLTSFGITAGSIYVTVSAAVATSSATVQDLFEPPVFDSPVPADDQESSDGIPLTADGNLTAKFSTISTDSGELIPATDLTVSLTSTSGRKLTTTTDDQGFCVFGKITPGLYTIDAKGPQGMLSYGIRTVAADFAIARIKADAVPQPVAMAVLIDAALTPKRDAGSIEHIISGVNVMPVNPPTSNDADDTPMHSAVNRSGSSINYMHEAVTLRPDGSLEGKLHLFDPATGQPTEVTNLNVSFVTENVVVANSAVNPDGSFEAWNLLPGIYSLVVAGGDGIGYMGVEIVAAPRPGPGDAIPTAMRLQGVDINMGMVQGAGSSGTEGGGEGEGNEETPPAEGPVGTGGGGGGTGGGAGAGGGGGLGEILGLAGAALGAAALANDDDGAASPGN